MKEELLTTSFNESSSRNLVKSGFVKPNFKEATRNMTKEQTENFVNNLSEDAAEKYADHDIEELGKDQMVLLPYPKPIHRYKIIHETYKNSLEEAYFWLLNYLRYDMGYTDIIKVTDVFAASETSAFGGVQQQRIGLQQDKVSQYLAVIGKMVKELFQIVRELRIIDERLGYHVDSKVEDRKQASSADITLKGVYIDMAEGGSKNPSSVYGMARELQFTTLPDLFFSTHPRAEKDVEKVVDALEGFNESVKRVLKRKLYSYLRWKSETEKEMNNRRRMTIAYLRQHYDAISLYLNWLRPYLKNIKRLQNKDKFNETPDIIAAFEGSMMELEILGKYLPQGNKEIYSCMLLSFQYRTRPSLSYTSEHYQRGPIHVGEITIRWRGYTWSDKDIQKFLHMKKLEDLELLSGIDGSIREAMDMLGDELKSYLEEAGGERLTDKEKKGKPKSPPKEKPKLPGFADPFKAIFGGLGDSFGAITSKLSSSKAKAKAFKLAKEKGAAKGKTIGSMWITYKNFKKGHRMVAW